jgi:hypothetical protein
MALKVTNEATVSSVCDRLISYQGAEDSRRGESHRCPHCWCFKIEKLLQLTVSVQFARGFSALRYTDTVS